MCLSIAAPARPSSASCCRVASPAIGRGPALPSGSDQQIRVGSLTIDFTARTVSNAGSIAHLTPKELDLLRYLTQHAGEVVPHRQLLQAVWGPDYGDQVEYLRVFIKNL